MFSFGVFYLSFQRSLLGGSKNHTETGFSRMVLGVQVSSDTSFPCHGTCPAADGSQTGLTALAMVVTRSSVASLQAKQGLPLGTQVVGWLVLGMAQKSFYCNARALR